MANVLPEVLILRQDLIQGANFTGVLPVGGGARSTKNSAILTYGSSAQGGCFAFNPDTIYQLLRVGLFVGSASTWSVSLQYQYFNREVVLADQAGNPVLSPAGFFVLDTDLVLAPGDKIIVRTTGIAATETAQAEVVVAREQVLVTP